MESLTDVGAVATRDLTRDDVDARNISLTPNEDLVHAALVKANKPMKAYELLDHLYDDGLRAPMTIYRALEGLQSKGRVQKILSQNAFVSVDPTAKPDFQAVITCRKCGDARLVPLAESAVRLLLGGADMKIASIVVEAVSDCVNPTCTQC